MSTRDYVVLFLIGLCAALAAALLQPGPDYMDAAYYYAGGERIFEGYGFTEPFIWNYLDQPEGIPNASHTYWMPLASMLAAVGMMLSGSSSFLSARLVFILMAALMPVLAAWLYLHLIGMESPDRSTRLKAWLVGLLAIFSGFYAIYITLTETFAIYIILGGVFFALGFGRLQLARRYQFLLLGATAGLMHLARADGILWLGAAVLVCLIRTRPAARLKEQAIDWKMFCRQFASSVLPMLAGYSVLMAPWYSRNLRMFGSLFSPGGTRTMWLTNYNQIFSYTPELINFSTWMQVGWAVHMQDRLEALKLNLSTLGAVQCAIVLAPLLMFGVWRLRREWWVRLMIILWLGVIALMTVIFPYSGGRGGYFHAGAGLQMGIWFLSVEGLDAAILWAARRRGWERRQALLVLGGGMVAISMLMTGWIFSKRVIGPNPAEPIWDMGGRLYQAVDQSQSLENAGLAAIVMVNNPPGYYAATGRSAVVIPDGDIEVMLDAARQFKAAYIILEKDHVEGLKGLYLHPEEEHVGLIYLETVEETLLFALEDERK